MLRRHHRPQAGGGRAGRAATPVGPGGRHRARQSSRATSCRTCSAAVPRPWSGTSTRPSPASGRSTSRERAGTAGQRGDVHAPRRAPRRVPVGKFKIGRIAQERKPHLTNAVVGDPQVSDQEWAQREGMVAFAGYPLVLEDELVGVMALFARHALSEITLDAMAAVANSVAAGDRPQAGRGATPRLSLVASKTENAVIITDRDRRIEWVNDGFTRITGYTPARSSGRNPGGLLQGPLTDPETVARIRRKLAAEAEFHRRDRQLPQGRTSVLAVDRHYTSSGCRRGGSPIHRDREPTSPRASRPRRSWPGRRRRPRRPTARRASSWRT